MSSIEPPLVKRYTQVNNMIEQTPGVPACDIGSSSRPKTKGYHNVGRPPIASTRIVRVLSGSQGDSEFASILRRAYLASRGEGLIWTLGPFLNPPRCQ